MGGDSLWQRTPISRARMIMSVSDDRVHPVFIDIDDSALDLQLRQRKAAVAKRARITPFTVTYHFKKALRGGCGWADASLILIATMEEEERPSV